MKKKSISKISAEISEFWSQKEVASFNDCSIKVAKFKGELPFHSHKHTDEVFIVLNGEITIETKKKKFNLKKLDCLTVPKKVKHRPKAKRSATVLMIEREGTGKLD